MGGKTTKAHRVAWKARDPEHAKEAEKRYRHSEKGRARSLEATRRRRARFPMEILVQGSRANAKRRGLEHTIADTHFNGVTCCQLSGLPFIKGDPIYGPSIDRIDNSVGYVDGNVRLILLSLNKGKGVGTDETLLTIARAMLAKHEERDVQ